MIVTQIMKSLVKIQSLVFPTVIGLAMLQNVLVSLFFFFFEKKKFCKF